MRAGSSALRLAVYGDHPVPLVTNLGGALSIFKPIDICLCSRSSGAYRRDATITVKEVIGDTPRKASDLLIDC